MNVSYSLILLTVLCCFGKQISAEDIKDSDGLSMDDYNSKSSNSSSDNMQPSTARKSITKRQSETDLDESFPGCGLRAPQIPGSNKTSSPKNQGSNRGKREILPNIAGGAIAKEHSWPWMAQLRIKYRNGPFVTCGASLISEKYLLTAAHCFGDKPEEILPSKYDVVLGAHFKNQGIQYPIKKILIHPNKKPGSLDNDIAILEVQNPVKLSEKVYPVCLPSDKLRNKIDRDNYDVTVAGWGRTSDNKSSGSNVLREVTVPVIPLAKCRRYFPHLKMIFFCTGSKAGGKNSCKGDSGSPLVANLEGKSYVQVGVVSFGSVRCVTDVPAGHARVSQFTKWISDNTDVWKLKKKRN